ncbi:PREDICTED: uncharacterized protein LOC102023216 [Chinchilla lanigera]|uniref:uncharacterized protein LOC102023216 n=1 Tax=Chinchilla lanigera TaxID=34839 RepID=UPI0006989839|nr:PREDICTED: uncharacterized protein LOC102023216 [Chinchilla lanigera]
MERPNPLCCLKTSKFFRYPASAFQRIQESVDCLSPTCDGLINAQSEFQDDNSVVSGTTITSARTFQTSYNNVYIRGRQPFMVSGLLLHCLQVTDINVSKVTNLHVLYPQNMFAGGSLSNPGNGFCFLSRLLLPTGSLLAPSMTQHLREADGRVGKVKMGHAAVDRKEREQTLPTGQAETPNSNTEWKKTTDDGNPVRTRNRRRKEKQKPSWVRTGRGDPEFATSRTQVHIVGARPQALGPASKRVIVSQASLQEDRQEDCHHDATTGSPCHGASYWGSLQLRAQSDPVESRRMVLKTEQRRNTEEEADERRKEESEEAVSQGAAWGSEEFTVLRWLGSVWSPASLTGDLMAFALQQVVSPFPQAPVV